MPAVIGLDFGTESVRALILEAERGQVVGTAARAYADGVISRSLPDSTESLPPEWALQNPEDWLLSAADAVRAVMSETGYPPVQVVGLGIDFTSCTVLPVDERGTPLCQLSAYRNDPHAWAKLWKHHAAQPQADRVNALATSRNEPWIRRYGGRISSEWLIPKALEILEESPSVYDAAAFILEGADWVVWQLTGRHVRNSCAAGYKATWHASDGYPSRDFLAELHPNLAELYRAKAAAPILPPGQLVGDLREEWSERMGLLPGVKVAVPIIDAHAAAIGGGSSQAGDLFMIMGTSTCHMLLGDSEQAVPGIAGVVRDGIVEGLYGYEAGQAASGDSLAWFVENALPTEYATDATRRGASPHEFLSELASNLAPGESGLLALDWLNGNRSTLVNADLSGIIIGLTLGTRPEEIYRALIESTAYGTRVIIDAFESAGLPIKNVRAGGTLAGNSVIAQIYADVLGREVLVSDSPEVSARGAAILGAAAAALFPSVAAAADALGTRIARTFIPRRDAQEQYDRLYHEFTVLYDYFGRGSNEVMKTLRHFRQSRTS